MQIIIKGEQNDGKTATAKAIFNSLPNRDFFEVNAIDRFIHKEELRYLRNIRQQIDMCVHPRKPYTLNEKSENLNVLIEGIPNKITLKLYKKVVKEMESQIGKKLFIVYTINK